MILVGNQRGNSADLARHLMSEDNERVHLHELRGFVSDTLAGALNESYAISKGTRCRQHLFSLSLNPPADEPVSAAEFERAIGRVEKKLGLKNQPRAIVFHEKRGSDGQLRRHCHAVWSRVDAGEMKAVQLSYSKRKLQAVSRDLFIHHGWDMPRGLIKVTERDPRNFSLAQWQQAKRIGKDPRVIKQAFQDAWALSDSKTAFSQALVERGYHVAKGDRRGFVAVDAISDEVFAIPKWVGIKTKAVRDRLGDENALPTIERARQLIAKDMLPKIRRYQTDVATKQQRKESRLLRKVEDQSRKQENERVNQSERQSQRRIAQDSLHQSRYRKGLRGLLDRLTGQHSRTKTQNQKERDALERHLTEQTATLKSRQDAERDRLNHLRKQTNKVAQNKAAALEADADRFEKALNSQASSVDSGWAEYRAKREANRKLPHLKAAYRQASKTETSGKDVYRERRERGRQRLQNRCHAPYYEQ